jgi:hypothetical protein
LVEIGLLNISQNTFLLKEDGEIKSWVMDLFNFYVLAFQYFYTRWLYDRTLQKVFR